MDEYVAKRLIVLGRIQEILTNASNASDGEFLRKGIPSVLSDENKRDLYYDLALHSSAIESCLIILEEDDK